MTDDDLRYSLEEALPDDWLQPERQRMVEILWPIIEAELAQLRTEKTRADIYGDAVANYREQVAQLEAAVAAMTTELDARDAMMTDMASTNAQLRRDIAVLQAREQALREWLEKQARDGATVLFTPHGAPPSHDIPTEKLHTYEAVLSRLAEPPKEDV
jgi:hypothetical protein